MTSVLTLKNIQQRFTQGGAVIDVLTGVDLEILQGQCAALVGPSGSGKSTLLHIAGLLEQPSAGTITINGHDIKKANDSVRTKLRRHEIGFIYQFHHLLPEFTALENVMMPQLTAGVKKAAAKERAVYLLNQVGLGNRLSHMPGQLSGGEQQRVSIARAFANNPALILADEPTGNLDTYTADKVFDVFMKTIRDEKKAALMVTHNPSLAKKADRAYKIDKGRLARWTGR